MRFIQLLRGFCFIKSLRIGLTNEEKTSIAQAFNVRLSTFNLSLRDRNFKP